VSKMKEHMMTCTDNKCEVCHPIHEQIIHLIKAMKAPLFAMPMESDYKQGFCDACDTITNGIKSYMMYNKSS
jgi:hypothetical protein